MNLFDKPEPYEVEVKEPIVVFNGNLFKNEEKVIVNFDSNEIIIGDTVYHEYDDKKAFGTVIGFEGELLTVDFTTEFSNEQKIDNFVKGIWKK